MILCIDVGASRMKWALCGSSGWILQGSVGNAGIGTLILREWQAMPRPTMVVGVNSAGEAQRVRVEGQLARWRSGIRWIHPKAHAGGVSNGYAEPAMLAPDRWVALVAAHRRSQQRESGGAPAVVVNAGTLVTVDALAADGRFQGGVLIPGLRTMLDVLAESSPTTRLANGRWREFPVTDADGAATGVIRAVCGAVEQMRHAMAAALPVRCYLTGGAAGELAAHLAEPVEVVDNLVLEGVLALAND